MDPTQLASIGLAVFVGVLVQTSVGFGAGLFAIPIMVWAGIEMPAAITIALVVVLFQTGWNCYQHRRRVPWRQTVPLLLLRVVTMPVGVLLLARLVHFGQDRVKQVVGLMLLTVLAAQWLLKVRPREHIHWGWTSLAGGLSGLLAGLLGMGGPPLVIWVMNHDWPSQRARVFLWALFLQMIPVQLPLLLWQFGAPVLQAAGLGVLSLPAALAGAVLGLRVGAVLSRDRLRRVAFALLAFLAVASVLAPLL